MAQEMPLRSHAGVPEDHSISQTNKVYHRFWKKARSFFVIFEKTGSAAGSCGKREVFRMHYVISDIHGCYDLYQALLEKIGFSDADTLFFLGDAADRGPEGIRVMQDLMDRKNVVCLLGNHEDMFRKTARDHGKRLKGDEKALYRRVFLNWTVRNGGDVTWDAYRSLPKTEQLRILDWMENLPWYYELTLNGRSFVLAHAGVGSYEPEKPLERCVLHDFIWERMDYSQVYYRNKLLITGHTPTLFFGAQWRGRMFRENNHIDVDCGAVYCGALGCLCLENLEEIVVSD